MGWRSQRATKRVLTYVAVIGVGGIAGLLAGFSADPGEPSELSPAEIVALRFPGDPSRIAAERVVAPPLTTTAAPTGYVLASAEETDPQATASLLFSPFATYLPRSTAAQSASLQPPATQSPATQPPATPSTALASPAAQPVATQAPATQSMPTQSASVRPALPPQLVTAGVDIPAAALAYADADDRAELAMPAARTETASLAPPPAKRALQPQPHPANPASASSGPVSASNAVLNNAQIASIRERLKLTSYQSQLWPSVESALRDITWQGRGDPSHKTAANPRGATIDPNSAPVQRLKSAAFPLIMSMSEDQKQEVRTMVRLMGLENLASQF
jgi:hypothetical protein